MLEVIIPAISRYDWNGLNFVLIQTIPAILQQFSLIFNEKTGIFVHFDAFFQKGVNFSNDRLKLWDFGWNGLNAQHFARFYQKK